MTVAERLAEAFTDLSKEAGLGTEYIVNDEGQITSAERAVKSGKIVKEYGVTSMSPSHVAELLEKDRAKYMRLVQIIDNCFADIEMCELEERDPGPGRSHTE